MAEFEIVYFEAAVYYFSYYDTVSHSFQTVSGFKNVDGWSVGFYGISTFVGYLTPNTFLCK